MKKVVLGLSTAAFLMLQAMAVPPLVIDENQFLGGFEDKLAKFVDDGQATKGSDLVKQLKDVIGKEVKIPAVRSKGNDYSKLCPSVGVIASIFKCGKCDKWHVPGMATGWVASDDGIVVTNYHVIMGAANQVGLGITFPNGNVYPVTEVLSADPAQDIAIIRVKANKGELSPVPLGPDAPVGSDVSIISHPDGRYYMMTEGKVARYHNPRQRHQPAKPAAQPADPNTPATEQSKAEVAKEQPKAPIMMNVTAEYAKGSSGGPIFDSRGRVVGMVSSTQSIYYGNRNNPNKTAPNDPGPFQMVIRNCVPVCAITNLLKTGK